MAVFGHSGSHAPQLMHSLVMIVAIDRGTLRVKLRFPNDFRQGGQTRQGRVRRRQWTPATRGSTRTSTHPVRGADRRLHPSTTPPIVGRSPRHADGPRTATCAVRGNTLGTGDSHTFDA